MSPRLSVLPSRVTQLNPRFPAHQRREVPRSPMSSRKRGGTPRRLPVRLVSLVSDTSRHRHMHHTWGKGLGMRMGDSYAHTWMKRFCPSVPPETGSESHHPRPRHARTHCLTLSPLPAQALVLPLPCHHKHSRRAWWERDPHSRHLVKLLHPMSGSKHGCAVLPPPPPTVPSSPSAYSMPSP